MRADPREIVSPEWLAAALVGLLAVTVLASGALASPGSPAPSASVAPTVRPSASPTMDPVIRNALLTALVINQRLTDRGGALEAEVDGDPSGSDIAAILRSVNTDVLIGKTAADRLLETDATAALGEDLAALYDDLRTGNEATLGVSIQNVATYVDRAQVVIEQFGVLPAINDRIDDALDGRPSGPGGSGALPSAAPTATPSSAPTPTPTPSPTPRPSGSASPSASPVDSGLVPNGTFDTGLAGWRLDLAQGAEALATHDPTGGPDDSGAVRIAIVEGSTSRSGISWTTPGLRLVPGANYRVSASIRASAPREVRIRLEGAGGQTTTARIFQVGQAWSDVQFDMTQLASESSVLLAFDLGRGDPSVWIDNISVVEIPG